MRAPDRGTELHADHVMRRFGSRINPLMAVDDVTVTVCSGQSLGLVGESGSGKSTLGRLLVGLDRPTAGTVTLDGVDLDEMGRTNYGRRTLRRTVQYVAQDTSSSFDPRKTLRNSARRPAQLLRGMSADEADAELNSLMTTFGLPLSVADRRPWQTSGGQRQRMALVRALIVRPKILVCDEVVSALDVSVQGAVLNYIKRYCREHDCGLVFISHGLPATAFISHEIAVMTAGKVVEQAPASIVVNSPKHEYTRRLIDSYRAVSK